MKKKSTITILLAVGLVLFGLGCDSVTRFTSFGLQQPSSTVAQWPQSSFVFPRKSVQVGVGEELHLESYHRSPAKLATLIISVNGQPIGTFAPSGDQAPVFPDDFITVRVLANGPSIRASSVEPKFPTAAWTVRLGVIGRIPGTYDLRLVAIDTLGRTGNPIVQRIEVR